MYLQSVLCRFLASLNILSISYDTSRSWATCFCILRFHPHPLKVPTRSRAMSPHRVPWNQCDEIADVLDFTVDWDCHPSRFLPFFRFRAQMSQIQCLSRFSSTASDVQEKGCKSSLWIAQFYILQSANIFNKSLANYMYLDVYMMKFICHRDRTADNIKYGNPARGRQLRASCWILH